MIELIVLVLIGVALWVWLFRSENRGTTPRQPTEWPDYDAIIPATPPPRSQYATAIRTAIRERRRLWIRYADAEGVISERHVAPYSWDGWIMGAYCFGVDAPRNFRADRIMDLE